MDYVPIMLNVSDRNVVVIGGGEAAFKKVRNLSEHCSKITVIASELNDKFRSVKADQVEKKIERMDQVEQYLDSNSIVIIATDDPKLNSELEGLCKRKGLLFNRVDDNESPFIFPASFESNGAIISVSTSGKSPSFTRFLRDRLRENADQYTTALPVMEQIRVDAAAIRDLHKRAVFFSKLLDTPKFWELIRKDLKDDAYKFAIEFLRKEMQENEEK